MTVIFKLGGSLLNLPGLANKLRTVVAQRSGNRCLFVTGGGAATDVVREWSRIHLLDEETSHRLAVSSLGLNRQFLGNLLGWNSVSSRTMADRLWVGELSPLLLEMTGFLATEEGGECDPLPHHWSVTSDSLAAWTAIRWPASELILLKSIPMPRGLTAQEACRRNLVDEFFPRIASQLPRISWCNVRGLTMAIEPWMASSAEDQLMT